MTRATKRPAPQLSSDDPIEFVAAYCKRRKIAYEIGHSDVEKQCLAAATSAREQYKTMRNALHASAADAASATDRRGLSPAQKYTIRLHNNRKSANASKVFAEVLKREQAARLASIPCAHHQLASNRTVQTLTERLRQLENKLAAEKDRSAALHKENQRLHARVDSHACAPRNVPAVSTSAAELVTTPPSSMPEPVCVAASTALHQRIVNSRTGNVVSSWGTMSPLALHESEGKEFHTGLTCSQSQDVDEKPSSASLPRVSLPVTSAVQIGVFSSQNSQDIPQFKSLNSDELVGPCPGSDFFNGSQPNSKLLCP